MAKYCIPGVWKDPSGTITHYSFHPDNGETFGRIVKRSKEEAIKLLETIGNSAITVVWNYKVGAWHDGETVTVVGNGSNKYLRSNPDDSVTDNLGHLPTWNVYIQ